MNWPELAALAREGVLDSTGFGEPFSIDPGSGAVDQKVGGGPLLGRFSATFAKVDPGTGRPLNSNRPNLFVNLADFATAPAQGHTVALRGKAFRVQEVQPDHEGGALLFLALRS